jgi:hypothetical protein
VLAFLIPAPARSRIRALHDQSGSTSSCFPSAASHPGNCLLAFLALLGLLRSLETARPAWRPRAAWDVDAAPLRPVLVLVEPQDELAVCEAAAEGAATLATYHDFSSEHPGYAPPG